MRADTSKYLFIVTLVSLIASLTGPVLAASPSARARAEALATEALRFARQGSFGEALVRFEESNRLYPLPETQHNIARSYEELGNYHRAYDYYQMALSSGSYAFERDGKIHLALVEDQLRLDHALYRVKVIPRGVQVSFEMAGGWREEVTKDAFEIWLPAGRVNVKSQAPGYAAREENIQVVANVDGELAVTLLPVQREGFLQVTVDRGGATVALSGQEVGRSPMPPLAWPIGTYVLTVSLPGYVTYERHVTIHEEETTELQVILEPRPAEILLGTPSWVGWTLFGTGVAAGAAAAGLQFGYALPLSRQATEERESYDPEWKTTQDRALAYETGTIVAASVGGALIATGLYFLIFDPPRSADDEEPAFVPQISVAPDGGVVGGAWRF